jgi:hypothetical protein
VLDITIALLYSITKKLFGIARDAGIKSKADDGRQRVAFIALSNRPMDDNPLPGSYVATSPSISAQSSVTLSFTDVSAPESSATTREHTPVPDQGVQPHRSPRHPPAPPQNARMLYQFIASPSRPLRKKGRPSKPEESALQMVLRQQMTQIEDMARTIDKQKEQIGEEARKMSEERQRTATLLEKLEAHLQAKEQELDNHAKQIGELEGELAMQRRYMQSVEESRKKESELYHAAALTY